MEKKINYIGWMGYGNIGDEAIYLSNKLLFNQYKLIPTKRSQYSQITLLGGGTILPNFTFSRRPSKYNYALGVGVRNPIFWGDYGYLDIVLTKRFKFRFLGVRGNLSRQILKKWGIKSEVVGDPVLILEPSTCARNNELIAVNISSDDYIWGWNRERVFLETTKLCKLLKKEGYIPILIPFWERDIPYIRRLSKITKVKIYHDWKNIQSLLNLIASSHILIGEKLHSLVFSAAAHTPFISLEYRPKCLDFSQSVGFEKYNIRTDKFSAKKVLKLVKSLYKNWDENHKLLSLTTNNYRKKLQLFAARIVEDIESLPDDKWATPNLLINLIGIFSTEIRSKIFNLKERSKTLRFARSRTRSPKSPSANGPSLASTSSAKKSSTP